MNKQFDCVEYQRAIRLKNYEEANGNFDLMLLNREKRLKNNELWKRLIDRKGQQNKTEYQDCLKVNEPEIKYDAENS